MAECHPVAYQWVSEAKMRGARSSTSTRASRGPRRRRQARPDPGGFRHRLLGALINHVLSNDLYFRDYVVAYTNAATLISEDFVDTEDLDGIFSGYDEKTGAYDLRRGPTLEGGRRGRPRRRVPTPH
jgi:formate dehydrogenase major subunit